MSAEDSLRDQDGRKALDKYLAHGGGIDLFRAYVERRDADRQTNAKIYAETLKRMESPSGLPSEEFECASLTILRHRILEELDPVIKDILKFCENQPPVDDQLPNLRSALRIGKGHAPIDSIRIKIKWEVQQRWIAAYMTMQDTRVYVSANKLAANIANETGISAATAINHWNEKLASEPWQGKWAQEIINGAKKKKKAPSKKAPSSKRVPVKPKHWQ